MIIGLCLTLFEYFNIPVYMPIILLWSFCGTLQLVSLLIFLFHFHLGFMPRICSMLVLLYKTFIYSILMMLFITYAVRLFTAIIQHTLPLVFQISPQNLYVTIEIITYALSFTEDVFGKWYILKKVLSDTPPTDATKEQLALIVACVNGFGLGLTEFFLQEQAALFVLIGHSLRAWCLTYALLFITSRVSLTLRICCIVHVSSNITHYVMVMHAATLKSQLMVTVFFNALMLIYRYILYKQVQNRQGRNYFLLV